LHGDVELEAVSYTMERGLTGADSIPVKAIPTRARVGRMFTNWAVYILYTVCLGSVRFEQVNSLEREDEMRV
jgi:hypothetical protein